MEITFEENNLTLGEYQNLYQSTDWDPLSDQQVMAGLNNSLYILKAVHTNSVIGMARIVGDGAVYFYIQDLVIDPKYKGQGLGREMVRRLDAYISSMVQGNVFVGLIAAEGTSPFYQKMGYSERPSNAPGMYKRLKP